MAAEVNPRVFSCVPSYFGMDPRAALAHYAWLPGNPDIHHHVTMSSALCHGFNRNWATALNWQRAGIVDYFLMHHDDIEIQTPNWFGVMVEEMKATGAAVLSVVQAIKHPAPNAAALMTSTAIDQKDPWVVRRLKLSEVVTLPETFSGEHTAKISKGNLLINTGLMLVDLSRKEFQETNEDGSMVFHFRMMDRIISHPETGELISQFRPEDWEFSRMCHARGLPVWATRKVKCEHHGRIGYPNYLE